MFFSYIFLPTITAIFLSLSLTAFIRFLALRLKVLSRLGSRHAGLHAKPMLGGAAIFLTFVLITVFYPGLVITKIIAAIIAATLLLIVVGIVDDIKPLSWQTQLYAQLAACFVIVASGVRLFYINNPFGGVLKLDQWQVNFPGVDSIPILGTIFIVIWLLVFANAFNWLDGIDGLASGVGSIAFIILALLSLTASVFQPPVAILSSILAGATLGFFIWNFPKAKIYLGGSSIAIGFILGAMSVFAGAKVATTFLVFAIPLIDVLWVIAGRFMRRKSIFVGDATHLHHRLLKRGWSEKKILVFLLVITSVAGVLSIIFAGIAKFIIILLFILGTVLSFLFIDKNLKSV
ncbi:MAG: hypothetical protein A3A80_04510 [Candidatus Terrybacteria bacterium RIFCSPLOWO2_01_FULL_44_24]|uniref:Undecaprenyl-phosphate alpha-N-acetylglucosaminyl 1-phosphate transferase n=1 Tax=Candidatus Terrybacteria bacterium RIFCSPHIGHO2_01_FULL_43_35 TaxID=1802361 RepID=A0A1G2PC37_9BACT|nr:MAG: hypothetical protein A2828_01385 [Candidatus Terrybacteria bacterium RIFCSPHIGHO2_01_FULL_43_35]OHA49682.1 MAG: hypothetical protein A3B75_01165 [Candidatus Terrybacteria bacterium RIFCSPHIGHO2_02_FULL_43_14]OHA51347.1 MAG: hypothetical protein A3A80_04510 [Candidatus Terrybacteria bacterium RIFCSPLOWO2_01_FULL_44_24]